MLRVAFEIQSNAELERQRLESVAYFLLLTGINQFTHEE